MMTGIITPQAMRNFLTSQLNVADDDQANLFIDEGFDSFSVFAVFLERIFTICARHYANLVVLHMT